MYVRYITGHWGFDEVLGRHTYLQGPRRKNAIRAAVYWADSHETGSVNVLRWQQRDGAQDGAPGAPSGAQSLYSIIYLSVIPPTQPYLLYRRSKLLFVCPS